MITLDEINRIKEEVKSELINVSATNGVVFHVDDSDFRIDDDALFIRVSPPSSPIRGVEYVGILSRLREKIQSKHPHNIVLVPLFE